MSRIRKFIPLLVLIVGLGLFFAFDLDEYFSLDALRDHRGQLNEYVDENYALSALIFAALYAVATAFSVPGGALLTVTGGFLFGIVAGTAFSLVGATIGATLVFLAARTAFADMLRARAGPGIERMRAGFQENALSYLLFLRLIPVFPFFLVNLAPAFLGVRLGTYVLGTAIGIVPGTFIFTLFGSGLGEIFDSGAAFSLAGVLTPGMMMGLAGLAVLSLLPMIYKRVRRGTGSPPAEGDDAS